MKLDLIKNSHLFLIESAKNVAEANGNEDRWPLAILHVVQALELTLKAMLEKQHRLFVYDNIDSPRKTVSISKALERLSNPELGIENITESEKKRITEAVELRNKITHFEFICSPEYAAARFSQIFALVTFLQSKHFLVEIETLLDAKTIQLVLSHKNNLEELLARAKQRIESEEIDSSYVWLCPECNEDTFVAADQIDKCYLCRKTAAVTYCAHCGELLFADDLIDFSELLEYDLDEGRSILINDFGYSDHLACENCMNIIKNDIENQLFERHADWMEMEYGQKQED